MAGGPSKVWTITVPARLTRPSGSGARSPAAPRVGDEPRLGLVRMESEPAAGRKRAGARAESGRPRHAAWTAYVLGPLLWLTPWAPARPRAWHADVLAIPAAAAWLLLGSRLPEAARLATGVILALAVATSWARSLAGARTPAVPRSGPWRVLAHPAAVVLLGLLVPGLGLMIARSRRRAAAAFWLLGPLTASWLVLANARRAWPVGDGGTVLETVLATAAVAAALTGIAWLVQALEGARRVTPTRPIGRADFVSLGLVAATLLFVVTFRPAALARQLHVLGAALQADGFRMIPLALCDAAATLDPATPDYAADGARLAGQLGLVDLARQRHAWLERQAREWERAAGAKRGGAEPAAPAGTSGPKATSREIW